MIRKLVSQGNNAFTITLPISWVRDNGLKKGDELHILSQGCELVIETRKHRCNRATEVNLDGKDEIITKVISILYMTGYDDVILKFSDKNAFKKVQDVIKNYTTSFETTEFSESKCRLKIMSDPDKSELNNALSRCYFLLYSQIENIHNSLRDNDLKLLKDALSLEDSLNRTTVFYRRLIIKNGQYMILPNLYLFNIIKSFESIGDDLKFLTQFMITHKPGCISEPTLDKFSQAKEYFGHFNSISRDMGLENFQSVYLMRKRMVESIHSTMKRASKHESIFLMFTLGIIQKMYEAYNYLFSIKFCKIAEGSLSSK